MSNINRTTEDHQDLDMASPSQNSPAGSSQGKPGDGSQVTKY